MRILECPPSDEQGYIDEADQFFMNPSSWLIKQYGNSLSNEEQDHLPTHIVMYNALLPVSYLCYCFICQCKYNIMVAKITLKKILILRHIGDFKGLTQFSRQSLLFSSLISVKPGQAYPTRLMNLLLIRKLNHG